MSHSKTVYTIHRLPEDHLFVWKYQNKIILFQIVIIVVVFYYIVVVVVVDDDDEDDDDDDDDDDVVVVVGGVSTRKDIRLVQINQNI